MASSAGRRLPMEKPSQQNHEQQQLQQQNQQPFKCPRCDSSNTKFCYYNNYSLSQPRHFCKACKRYWTRGGTLRSVPVGGGCRKNKRVKRPSASTSASAATASEPRQASVMARPSIDVSTTRSEAHVNPLFFDAGGGISYPRFHSAVDLPHRLPGALGLGFASPGFGSGDGNYIQDLLSSASILSGGNYSSDGIQCTNPTMIPPISGSEAPTAAIPGAVPTISSLLASTIQQQKLFNADLKHVQALDTFKGFSSCQDSRDTAADAENDIAMKEVKAEGLNLPGWSFGYQSRMDISDSVPHYWNMSSNTGSWHDPSNTGSSVPSLI
ncbi:hypothetical protein SAY87_010038 [Trapa incisa]|uniref:Dof zinc finger protein n=1 Tax=Trapa incisa TaxID=236973 RepID=A0AAN7GE11_9MYRT|nr:hypothetical protein SAY87_010038 [Trapa incisa]